MYPRLEVSKQLFHHFRRNICRIHQIRKKVRHFRDKRGLPDKCVTLYNILNQNTSPWQELFSVPATLFRVYELDRTEKRFLDLSISNEGRQKSLEFPDPSHC